MFKCKLAALYSFHYFWSVRHFRVCKGLSRCQMLLGNFSLHLYNICTRTLQCKISNFKRLPPNRKKKSHSDITVNCIQQVQSLLLRTMEERETEVDVVLHSLLVCLVCIVRLSFSFIFTLLSLSLGKGSLTEVERLLLLLLCDSVLLLSSSQVLLEAHSQLEGWDMLMDSQQSPLMPLHPVALLRISCSLPASHYSSPSRLLILFFIAILR